MSEAAAQIPRLPLNPVAATFTEYAPAFLQVRSKKGGLVPFVLNPVQARLEEIVSGIEARERPVRLLILKARQEGVSTWGWGRGYKFVTTKRGVSGMMVAHDDDSTRELFEAMRLAYDMAPEPRPMSRFGNKTELDFSNPDRDDRENPGLQSRFRVSTAGRRGVGRSRMFRFLHCSEVAFWDTKGQQKTGKKAKDALLGLLQCVPDEPGTFVVLESTANGVGGEFYKRWKEAEDPATAGDWVCVFLAWFIFPEYTRPLADGVWEPVPGCIQDPKEFELEEQRLRRDYKLTDGQLNWRRWAIVNKCGNDETLFRQEYPSSADEAFIMSGRPYFHRAKLATRMEALQQKERDLRKKGLRRYVEGRFGRAYNGRPQLVEEEAGAVRVYVPPRKDHTYIVTADVAEGVTVGEDSDFSAASAWDAYSGEQVATLRGHLDVEEFEKQLRFMGLYYGGAKIACEVNNHGLTVNVLLRKHNYPDLYLRTEFDALTETPILKPGWRTDVKTRPLLCDALQRAIFNDLVRYNDIRWIQEALSFVVNDRGKPEAQSGCHDDTVIEAGIAQALMQHVVPVVVKSSPYPKLPPGSDDDLMARDRAAALRAFRDQEQPEESIYGG